MWTTPVEKAVENVEKFCFSTAKPKVFENKGGSESCIIFCINSDSGHWIPCYVTVYKM